MNNYRKLLPVTTSLLFTLLLAGPATAQEEQEVPVEQEVEVLEESSMSRGEQRRQRRQDRRGAAGGGMMVGAVAGAALGSMGDAAGAGAVIGALAVGHYSYDQQRQDERTQMLADSIATPNVVVMPASATQPAAAPSPQETVGDVGKRSMQSLIGDWNFETWSLTVDGARVTGSGQARGLQAGENSVRVVITQVESVDFPEAQGGAQMLLVYDPGQGFFLENDFAFNDEVLKLIGEYMADTDKFNFYLVGMDTGSETPTGVLRSSMRVEIRASGSALWVAETYAYLDGEEKQIQSFQFSRR